MKRPSVLVVLLVALVSACSGNPSGSTLDSAGEDLLADRLETDADVQIPPDGTLPDGTPGDATLEIDVATDEVGPGDSTDTEGKATAFVTTSEDQLVQGPSRSGVVGDIVLANDVVRFVVRNQQHSLYSPYGGALVDADLVRPQGEASRESFLEMFPMTGLARVFRSDQMTIVDDGSESGIAIVRFQGGDGGLSLVDSVLPTFPVGIDVTVDYILRPGAYHLEISTTFRNGMGNSVAIDTGLFLQFSSRTTSFHDGCGFNLECLLSGVSVSWLASAAKEVSYGVAQPGEGTTPMLSLDKLVLLSGGSYQIPPDGEVSTLQYFIVGEGTIEDIRTKAIRLREEDPGQEVLVEVSLSDSWTQMSDAWIAVKRSGEEVINGWVTASNPGEDGQTVLHLPPGLYDFHLTVQGAAEAVTSGVRIVSGGENRVSLAANPAGWVKVTVTDDDDVPIPAAVTFQSGADAPWTRGIAHYVAIRNGERTFPLEAGEYTATFSRGLVWSIERTNVTVTAGEMIEVSGKIHEAMDTTGYIMMNSHEHSEWSIDSSVWVEDRIDNALANGIELMTPTDHDYFQTHQPTIEALGLGNQVKSALGCEVSPLWGHTTAAHCSNPPAYPTYFAIEYMLYDEDGKVVRPTTASEIYTQARNEFGCAFLAVNHPYRGGATFSTYDITATSNPAHAEPGLDLHLVDALEVYNKGDSLQEILTESLPAWYNLLNRGYSIAAIGGSDEHNYRGTYGNPRNMVASSTDEPGNIDLDEIYQNMKDFRSQVVGGPVLRLTVQDRGMGQTAVATDASVEIHLVVEAPEWMGLEFARVVMNGEVIKEFSPVVSGAVMRLDETFTVDLTSDAWLVAMAGSSLAEHEMVPVSGKQPFSITNPVFIDSDGNGYQAIHADGAPWD